MVSNHFPGSLVSPKTMFLLIKAHWKLTKLSIYESRPTLSPTNSKYKAQHPACQTLSSRLAMSLASLFWNHFIFHQFSLLTHSKKLDARFHNLSLSSFGNAKLSQLLPMSRQQQRLDQPNLILTIHTITISECQYFYFYSNLSSLHTHL